MIPHNLTNPQCGCYGLRVKGASKNLQQEFAILHQRAGERVLTHRKILDHKILGETLRKNWQLLDLGYTQCRGRRNHWVFRARNNGNFYTHANPSRNEGMQRENQPVS